MQITLKAAIEFLGVSSKVHVSLGDSTQQGEYRGPKFWPGSNEAVGVSSLANSLLEVRAAGPLNGPALIAVVRVQLAILFLADGLHRNLAGPCRNRGHIEWD